MNLDSKQSAKRYMPGLDGLRALSVIAVIAYHLNMKWAQGGFIGVGVFFVLSGYLITDHLLLEWQQTKRLSLTHFWIRRFRRLLPAMICMIIVVMLWLTVSDPSRVSELAGDVFSSLFYVHNWYLIFEEVSYFNSFGPPSPIGHLWSLAIEEQFYFVWPLVLLIGIKAAQRRGRLVKWILMLAILSAIVMGVLYEPGGDPSRVYYGTDTRAFALLIGAALAIVWPSTRISSTISMPARRILDMVGTLGIVLLIAMIYQVNEFNAWNYPMGLLIVSVISMVLIAVLVHPASRLGLVMGCRLLVWIGKRSYSLYIWHYPVIILSRPQIHTDTKNLILIVGQLIVTVIVAALSYRFIEEPMRRGSFQKLIKEADLFMIFRKHAILILLIVIMTPLILYGCSNNQLDRTTPGEVSISQKNAVSSQESREDDPKATSVDPKLLKGEDFTFIGDSVLVGAEPYLKEKLPGIIIDGKESRQMSHVQDIINSLREDNRLGRNIVIELGTNGLVNEKQLRAVLASLEDNHQVWLVTTRVPRNWQEPVNNTLKEVAEEFSNTRIIDWYSASQGKEDLFYEDGVHLKPDGYDYYASFLLESITSD